MIVADVMTKEFLSVSPKDNAVKTGELMERESISAAMVIEDGVFCGIISKETFVAHIERHCDRQMDDLLVEDLMETDIYTVKPDDEIIMAVNLHLTQKNTITRLPVIKDLKIVGYLSVRDLSRVFLNEMIGKFRVSDLMHYDPVYVYDYTPISEVVKRMKNMSVRRVVVMAGEKLVGVITMKDLSIHLFSEIKRANCIDHKSDLTAQDIMTKDPFVLKPNQDAISAAKMMIEKNIGGIPVLGDRLEGMITGFDLLKGFQILDMSGG